MTVAAQTVAAKKRAEEKRVEARIILAGKGEGEKTRGEEKARARCGFSMFGKSGRRTQPPSAGCLRGKQTQNLSFGYMGGPSASGNRALSSQSTGQER